MGYFFHFSRFWMIPSKLNKFRIKKLDCYIVSDLKFLHEIQAILPETRPLSAQMSVLSSFFQMFIVLGMYYFAPKVKRGKCKVLKKRQRDMR